MGKRTLKHVKNLNLNPSFASPRTVRRGKKEERTSVLMKAAVGFRSCSLLISTHCVLVGIVMRLRSFVGAVFAAFEIGPLWVLRLNEYWSA